MPLGSAPSSRIPRIVSVSTVLALFSLPAAAVGPERPALPSWSMAGDDGAAAMWVNPANLGLDSDRAWMVSYGQQLSADTPSRVSLATNTGPLATGLSYQSGTALTPSWWTLSTGLGLRLDRNLAAGVHLGWQLPEGDENNYVTWDLGTTWRPRPWVGVSGVARNLGSPDPSHGVHSQYGPGLVVRPFGDRLMIGAEYLLEEREEDAGLLQATLRIQPARGVVIRGSADQTGAFGAGLEISLGGAAAGAHGRVVGTRTSLLAYATGGQIDGPAWQPGARIAHFDVDGSLPYHQSSGIFAQQTETYLHLLERLNDAASDRSVRGVFIHLEETSLSMAQVEELRGLMATAQRRGKKIVVYMEGASSNSAYLLASAADKVYLHPAGELDLVGLSAELRFFRGALDMLGVTPQYARRSEYKSGPEPMLRTGASEPARKQMNALLDDLSENWTGALAEGRSKAREDIQRLVDQAPFTAADAVEHGLIDGLKYPDEMREELEEMFEGDVHLLKDYAARPDVSGWRANHEIAVVKVTGTIVGGDSSGPGLLGGGHSSGADTVVRQLRAAAREDSVKAVVLRVDSPGGSAFASDQIWRAVEQVKKEGKPVIVSMGGMAASGGYYVSAGADAIYANPSTITGSIGVYAGKFSAEDAFGKLGIETELYTRGRNAAMWSMSRPWDDVEFAAIDRMVGETYDQFKQRVQDGRELNSDRVEEVARGQVWSGRAAADNGLVDEIGGFHDAVQRAREEAGINQRAQVELVSYSDNEGINGYVGRAAVQTAQKMGIRSPVSDTVAQLPAELQFERPWWRLGDDDVWAMMPYHLEVD